MKKNLFNFGDTIYEEKKEEYKATEITAEKRQDAQDVINKYSSMNENQLEGELFKTILQQKENGTFDKNNILNSVNMLGGYLSEEQRQKINNLLNKY